MTIQRNVDPFEADIRSEPCPNCPAGVDEPCRSSRGHRRSEAHRGRERMWTARRARELANGTGERRPPLVDWDRPDWGGHVAVSSNGDLAHEAEEVEP